jgi:NADPH-dependent 2,4-dienoyl-CoA reductase/sulfur reductase-like enzyme
MTEVLRPSSLPDPFREGLHAGWKVIDASTLTDDRSFEADVAIVGTGAGGGTAAEILSDAGLSVVMIEGGPPRHVVRFPHARIRCVSAALSGVS